MAATVATSATKPDAHPEVSQLSQGVVAVTEVDLDERTAMALEGGVPAPYALAFAMLQAACPEGCAAPRWEQAVDDAGRFLDRWGSEAERLGWPAVTVIGPGQSSLVWALQGRRVMSLSPGGVALVDGTMLRHGHEGA